MREATTLLVVVPLAVLARWADVGRDVASDGVIVFSVPIGFEDSTTSPVLDADAVRRRVACFVSCSWLPDVALSDFERALVLLRFLVGVGFACSFSSGDSGVFLMKKTPFYRVMRHKWRRKSLFTATKKDCHLLHPCYREEKGQSLAGAVPGMFQSAL